MTRVSRRAIAKYGADKLLDGKSADQVARQLVSLLVESGRTNEADFLLEDIAWELEKRRALATSRVTSAVALTQSLDDELKRQLKQALGVEEVNLERTIDKSVLGGVRVETAGRVWDETLKRKLTELKEAF